MADPSKVVANREEHMWRVRSWSVTRRRLGILAVVGVLALLATMFTAVPAQAGHISKCTGNIQHGAQIVNACVRLYRDEATNGWFALGEMSTNSGAVHMRISALRLYVGGVLKRAADTVDQYGGHLAQDTLPPYYVAPGSGLTVMASMGFRWVWGDGTCYPNCDPTRPATISVWTNA
jgi:hypothetical protein